MCWIPALGRKPAASRALIRANWLPPPDAINVLPQPLRKDIDDLHGRTDSSGDVAELTIAPETGRALSSRARIASTLADPCALGNTPG